MHPDDDKTHTFVPLTSGTMVSHYRIIEKIGAGGMGEVYLAEETKLDRKVALKFLPQHLCQDADCRARFTREAQAAAKLNHPNIVTIHEVSEFNGRPFFAMENVEGPTLRDLCKRKELPLSRMIELAIQICEGLTKAHLAGIVHRDIKPSNILIDRDGRAKIVDFGLASVRGSEHLTKSGSTLGTVGYMSPEQARGEEVDARSDLFSLGAVLYEMIAGRSPFKAESEIATVKNVIEAVPEPLARYKNDVPDELQRIVSKALTKDKSLRYQHADEVLADLRAIQQKVPHHFPRGRKNKKLPLLVGGSVLLAAVLIAGYFYLRPRYTPPAAKSIAVLPFVDMSPERDQEYFCDGITEELINRLSHVKNLKVPARTSAFSFKGKLDDIRAIGDKLKVETVLEGSVRKAGSQIRITTQLINVVDGYHIWSETYDRELDDVFAIQDEISSAIVAALNLRLTNEEMAQMSRRPTNNVAAYECYLLADHEVFRFTEDGIRRSVHRLEAGIEKYGENALLFAGMAMALSQLANIGAEQEDYITRAEEWANRALAIDPYLAEAHIALAGMVFLRDYPENWRLAVGHYRKALELSPNTPDALRGLALWYTILGQYEKGGLYLAIADTVDPLNTWNRTVAGYIHIYEGRHDLALADLNRAFKEDRQSPVIHLTLAWAYILGGQIDSALAIIDHAVRVNPQNTFTKCALLFKYGLQKDQNGIDQVLSSPFYATCRRDLEFSYYVAAALALLGDRDRSLDWLTNAVNRGFINYPTLQQNPFLDNLRDDDRFKKLMERVKYEWEHLEV